MKRFEDIRKTFAEFGSKIKETTVDFVKRLLEIVKKDIASDIAEEPEEKTTSNRDNIIKTAIDAVASIVAIAVVAAVSNIFRKIK